MEIGGVTKPITNSNTILFYKLKNKRISKAENINIQDLKKIINNKKMRCLIYTQIVIYQKLKITALFNTNEENINFKW